MLILCPQLLSSEEHIVEKQIGVRGSGKFGILGSFPSAGQMATTDEPKRQQAIHKAVKVLMLKLLLFCYEKSSSYVPLSSLQQSIDSLATTPHRSNVNLN